MLGFLLITLVQASPKVTNSEITAIINQYNAGAHFTIPNLIQSQLTTLQNGEVVTILDNSAGADQPRRAVGYMLSGVAKNDLWVACQDPHAVLNSSVKELRTQLNADQSAYWYGFFDLPWPFSDRHWMVRSWNTTSLASKSNNNLWEHPWDLLPDGVSQVRPFIESNQLSGVTLELIDEAVYTPVSRGAWGIMEVNSDTRLVVYHATTVIGGNIPDSSAVRYTVMTLSDMMKDMEKRATNWVPNHYVSGHVGILGGDNQNVPTY